MLHIVFCFLVVSASADLRTWTDNSGEFSREATFDRLDVDARVVLLTTPEGKRLQVPFEKLSKTDQRFVLECDGKRPDGPSIGLMAFAVPINDMKKKKLVLPKHKDGIIIYEVSNGGPSMIAGLQVSDVIFAVDNTPIKTMEDLMWAVKKMKIDKSYEIHVERLDEGAGIWGEQVFSVTPLARSALLEAIKSAPPMAMGGFVSKNSIGIPVVKIAGRNLTNKDISALVIELQCFNRFDEPVLGFGGIKSNKVSGIYQETIKANSTLGIMSITLNGHETASVVKIYLKKVKFDDGSEWTSDGDVYIGVAKS